MGTAYSAGFSILRPDIACVIAAFNISFIETGNTANIFFTDNAAVFYSNIFYNTKGKSEQSLIIRTIIDIYSRNNVTVATEFAIENNCIGTDRCPVIICAACFLGYINILDQNIITQTRCQVIAYCLKLCGCVYECVGVPVIFAVYTKVIILIYLCHSVLFAYIFKPREYTLSEIAVYGHRAVFPYSGIKPGKSGYIAKFFHRNALCLSCYVRAVYTADAAYILAVIAVCYSAAVHSANTAHSTSATYLACVIALRN